MSRDTKKQEGGFHFGNIGGSVAVTAGGDVVGRDKTTTIQGFKDERDKEEFTKQVEALRSALREIKSQVDRIPGFDEEAREQMVLAVMQQVADLKTAAGQAATVPVGAAAPQDK